jgi:hypothetical protein
VQEHLRQQSLARSGRSAVPDSVPDIDAPESEVRRFAAQMERAMRANGGEPYMGDGLSFWERAVAAVTSVRDRVAQWAKQTFQDFVGRVLQERVKDRDDPGFER